MLGKLLSDKGAPAVSPNQKIIVQLLVLSRLRLTGDPFVIKVNVKNFLLVGDLDPASMLRRLEI